MDVVRILSIDGGGIRGIIPATVLAEIENRAGKRTHELFDLIAGTSTGGIIALSVVKPGRAGGPEHAATDIARLYEDEGRNIFKRSLWHRITALGNLLEEKYPATGLEKVLDTYLGDTKVSDSLTDVFITSYDLEHRDAFFFRSSKARNDPQYDFPMSTAARATASAPVYFEPLGLKGIAGDPETYSLIDGGVYANNPAMCAFIEARFLHPEATSFVVLSLGTGEQARPIHQSQAESWGLVNWAVPILNVVFDGITDTIDFQLGQVIGDSNGPFPGSRYVRIQPRLSESTDDLDNVDPTNIAELKELAKQAIRQHSTDIDQIISALTTA